MADTGERRPAVAAGIEGRLSAWQHTADKQFSKPVSVRDHFSGSHYQHLGHHQDDVNYGRPIAGSKTELRGRQADVHVSSEIIELCNIIGSSGVHQADGSVAITFGQLFEIYTKISNKVVGMLMRARRQGLVQFEGEMLFQRRDDDVIIRLVRTPDELLEDVDRRKQELRHHPAGSTK
jgi:hypothetical protein